MIKYDINQSKLSHRVLHVCLPGFHSGNDDDDDDNHSWELISPPTENVCSHVFAWTIWPIAWLWALLFGSSSQLGERQFKHDVAYRRIHIDDHFEDV